MKKIYIIFKNISIFLFIIWMYFMLVSWIMNCINKIVYFDYINKRNVELQLRLNICETDYKFNQDYNKKGKIKGKIK